MDNDDANTNSDELELLVAAKARIEAAVSQLTLAARDDSEASRARFLALEELRATQSSIGAVQRRLADRNRSLTNGEELEKYWPTDVLMRDGKCIRVHATNIGPDGVRVLFLTPEQYAEYKRVRHRDVEFAHTHAITIDPPEGFGYWTPPNGVWWVLFPYDQCSSCGVRMVDAKRAPPSQD